MTSGKRKWLLIGPVLLIVILAIQWHFAVPARKEPVYQGKTLTQWLKQLDDGQAFGISSSQLPTPTRRQVEAAEAIRAIGAEALPLLMQDLHSTAPTNVVQFSFRKTVNDVVERVLHKRPFFEDGITETDRVHWRAAQGLAALGPIAKPEIPELKRLLYTNFWHSSIKEAAYALSTIGPEGVAILTNAVGPTTEWSGMCAIWALGQHPAVGSNVIPFLMSATSSPSEGTACGSLQALGLIHTDGQHVIPVLSNALNSGNISIRQSAAFALGHFGPEAASTAPLLRKLADDPRTTYDAGEALRKIESHKKE